MIRRIFAIAQNTFRESLRDRILWSVCVVMCALLALSLFAGSISLGQDVRLIVDLGLTVIYLLQLFVAIFIGSMLIVKEVERRTFFLLLPKPIRREEVILGKCIGLAATTTVVTMLSLGALFGVLFLKGIGGYYVPLLFAVLLSVFESVLLIMLSLFFSGLTSPTLSAVYTIAFFLIGHSGSILNSLIESQANPVAQYLLKFAYYVLPNLEKFNIRNDIVYGMAPNLAEIGVATLYAACYGAFLFLLARAMFHRKEF